MVEGVVLVLIGAVAVVGVIGVGVGIVVELLLEGVGGGSCFIEGLLGWWWCMVGCRIIGSGG